MKAVPSSIGMLGAPARSRGRKLKPRLVSGTVLSIAILANVQPTIARVEPGATDLTFAGVHRSGPEVPPPCDQPPVSDQCPAWVGIYSNPEGNGQDAILDGLERPLDIARSPDGSTLFVTGLSWNDAEDSSDVTTVAFDPGDGSVLWVARRTGPRHDFDVGFAVEASPDGSRVYVVGAQDGTLQPEQADPALLAVAYEAETGQELWSFEGQGRAGYFLAVGNVTGPDGPEDRLYVAGSRDDGNTLLALDGVTGEEVWEVPYAPAGFSRLLGMRLSPAGDMVVLGGDAVSEPSQTEPSRSELVTSAVATEAHPDAPAGTLLWERRVLKGRATWYAHAFTFSPDGSRIFVSTDATRDDPVSVIRSHDVLTVALDASDGDELWSARFSGFSSGGQGQNRPYAIASSGDIVYVAALASGTSELDDDIALLAYDEASGELGWSARYGLAGHAWEVPGDMLLTPDGASLYVTGFSSLDKCDYVYGPYVSGNPPAHWGSCLGEGFVADLVTLGYDAQTGSQRWVARWNESAGGRAVPSSLDIWTQGGRSLALAPDGSSLYVAGLLGRHVDPAQPSPAEPGNHEDYGVLSYDVSG